MTIRRASRLAPFLSKDEPMQGVIGRIRARLAKAVTPAPRTRRTIRRRDRLCADRSGRRGQAAQPHHIPGRASGQISARSLHSVAFACRLRGEYPVVVMSELRPDLIAVSTAPIEFIPTFRHLPFRADEYERYVQRRWSLMLAKWNFGKQIELNMSFDDFVADQLAAARIAQLTPTPLPATREADRPPSRRTRVARSPAPLRPRR